MNPPLDDIQDAINMCAKKVRHHVRNLVTYTRTTALPYPTARCPALPYLLCLALTTLPCPSLPSHFRPCHTFHTIHAIHASQHPCCPRLPRAVNP